MVHPGLGASYLLAISHGRDAPWNTKALYWSSISLDTSSLYWCVFFLLFLPSTLDRSRRGGCIGGSALNLSKLRCPWGVYILQGEERKGQSQGVGTGVGRRKRPLRVERDAMREIQTNLPQKELDHQTTFVLSPLDVAILDLRGILWRWDK